VLVGSRPDLHWPGEDYIYVDWGPGFYAKHREYYPDLGPPGQVVNIGWLAVELILVMGGSCFLPRRMAQPLLEAGRLFQVEGGPELALPAYMVFGREADSDVLREAVEGLRGLAREEAAQSQISG
jgi:LysR family transcriptional regulator, flagellar master operon regulator